MGIRTTGLLSTDSAIEDRTALLEQGCALLFGHWPRQAGGVTR